MDKANEIVDLLRDIALLQAQNDRLLKTLAQERDAFGKRETELMAEVERLKGELEEQKIKDLEMFGQSISRDGKRIHPTDFYKSEMELDRDDWRALAEGARGALKIIETDAGAHYGLERIWEVSKKALAAFPNEDSK